MIKRLNFLLEENVSSLDDKLDLSVGNYKDALDFAITKTLTASPMLKPGPYLGIVLRIDEPKNGTWGPFDFMTPWKNDNFGAGSESKNRIPESFTGYKVRIPEFDAAIPEPPDICQSPAEESDAQKYIEMHTTFMAKSDAEKAAPGQIVWVDFGDYKTKDSPIFLGPYFNAKGEVQMISPKDSTQSAKAAFGKCAGALGGSPDGFGIAQLYNTFKGGLQNWWVGLDANIETEEKGSVTPKNTFPKECLLVTSQNVDNTPDNEKEEENLTFLQEEVIPRLLPIMQESDSRFVITSIYRSDALNAKVGGNANSYHAKGLALDFGGLSNLEKDERDKIFMEAIDHLKKNKSKLPWLRTVIAELWRNHIHIDIYQPPQKSGSTTWRTWKVKRSKLEAV